MVPSRLADIVDTLETRAAMGQIRSREAGLARPHTGGHRLTGSGSVHGKYRVWNTFLTDWARCGRPAKTSRVPPVAGGSARALIGRAVVPARRHAVRFRAPGITEQPTWIGRAVAELFVFDDPIAAARCETAARVKRTIGVTPELAACEPKGFAALKRRIPTIAFFADLDGKITAHFIRVGGIAPRQ